MLWEIGGAQTDTARLRRDNVDFFNRRITYNRQKLESIGQGSVAIVIGDDLLKLLNQLPEEDWLFPNLARQDDKVRASRFRKVADRLGFTDISLHSYQAANLQQAYVSNSRFSHTQTIFTTDKERAFDAMAKFEERPLALEVVKPTASEIPQPQEKEKMPVQTPEKIGRPIKQKLAEPLEWNPASPKIGMRL